jgi:hypothetical protein
MSPISPTTHHVDYTDNPVDDGPTAHLRGYSPRIRRG